MKNEKLHFDAHLPNLLKEVLNNQTCSVLRTPINITRHILLELAQLAIEIDDPRLHRMMLRLGLYEVTAHERVERIKELDEEIKRFTPHAKQRDVYRDALKDLLKVVDDITGQECCEYGHGEEISRIQMIADNEKPCEFKKGRMCEKHQVYCKRGYFGKDCEIGTTLFPEKE